MKSSFLRFSSAVAPAFCRRALLALSAFALSAGLMAQDKFRPVVMSEWTATDGIPTPGERGNGILLPGGSQLSRVFAATRVELRLVSRPVFNSIPADWASVELGPASLTFVRDMNGGGMVLLGDEPLALPFALALDAAGRSAEPLDIVLGYDQKKAKATLTVQKVLFDVEATAAAGEVEVAVSAGRSTAWLLDTVEVAISQVEVSSSDSGQDTATTASAKILSSEESAAQRRQGVALARAFFAANEDAAGEKALTDFNRNPRHTAQWHLESANELIQAAFSLNRAGKPQKAAQLARRALEHTEKAARKAARQAARPALAATAESTAGFIQERLLADYASAKAFYESAALRQPNGQAANELKRLHRVENEARRKAGEVVPEDEISDEAANPPADPATPASAENQEEVLK